MESLKTEFTAEENLEARREMTLIRKATSGLTPDPQDPLELPEFAKSARVKSIKLETALI